LSVSFFGVASAMGATTIGCGTRATETPVRAASAPRASGGSLDAWIDSVRQQHDIPALAAIVFRADTILARGISGVRRTDTQSPIELRDRFQLGSNTKAITAAVLGSLVEEGKLTWNTTLVDIFPELRDSMSAEFRAVTVPLLLSHHAGVSPFTDTDDKDFKSIPRLSGTPTERRAQFTAWVLRHKPASPIGGKAVYSNGGYTIAGAIAERIAGKSWESLVRERVFAPLGIDGTFAWSDSPDVNQPWGHHETRRGANPVDPRDPDEKIPPIIWPAGSVELSLDDYARFLQANLRGQQGRDTPMLKAATIKT
jgi:CubicO group peptidase (beta-lactamase class C family)